MKNYSTMAIALIVAFTLNSVAALANDEVKKNDKNIPGLEFRYIGSKENQPVFLLNLANAEEDEYTISFRDKNGNVLYSDRLKGSNITKRFFSEIVNRNIRSLHFQTANYRSGQNNITNGR